MCPELSSTCRAVLDHLQSLKSSSGVSYLDRNEGRDHLIVNGLFIGARTSMYCEGVFRQPFPVPSLANVIRLVVEAPGTGGFKGYSDQSSHTINADNQGLPDQISR